MFVRLIAFCVLSTFLASPALAAPCPTDPAALARAARRDCPPPAPRKIEPYDPDRQRAGSRPGFVDLGNGTEVRFSGRGRYEGDVRR